MSIARTTPAQKPRGFSSKTLLTVGDAAVWLPLEVESRTEVVTTTVYLWVANFRRLRFVCDQHGSTGSYSSETAYEARGPKADFSEYEYFSLALY
jgi:hypothetical protein